MNRATLAEVQRLRCYPSITLLMNTTPGVPLTPSERGTAQGLLQRLDDGLEVDVSDALRLSLTTRLANLVDEHAAERVTVDDTFTTRDLVADLNRTALFCVRTISERRLRRFVGDRERLVEERNEVWPLDRAERQGQAAWTREVDNRLRADATHAIDHLDDAVSAHRYAGGVHEVWALAHDGRIDTLIVERGFRFPARIDENNQLHPAEDPEHPDVNDDAVDDTMEIVLQHGGHVVIVDDQALAEHQRIAAILWYSSPRTTPA
jgi:hypothetical protein